MYRCQNYISSSLERKHSGPGIVRFKLKYENFAVAVHALQTTYSIWSDLELLFCRGRQRTLTRCITYVQSHCALLVKSFVWHLLRCCCSKSVVVFKFIYASYGYGVGRGWWGGYLEIIVLLFVKLYRLIILKRRDVLTL